VSATADHLEYLRREIIRLEQLREALLASRDYAVNAKPHEPEVPARFRSPKSGVSMPIWGAASASELAAIEDRLPRLRADLQAAEAASSATGPVVDKGTRRPDARDDHDEGGEG
jgi:hypothetical protein